MRHNALGLVEVRGYLGAIAAADAALKAASVYCIGVEIIKGGLVTIKLGGDVGAVQSAVAAGAEVAAQLDVLVTRHVIARMHEETADMVVSLIDVEEKQEQQEDAAKGSEPDEHASLNIKKASETAASKSDVIRASAETKVKRSDEAPKDKMKESSRTKEPKAEKAQDVETVELASAEAVKKADKDKPDSKKTESTASKAEAAEKPDAAKKNQSDVRVKPAPAPAAKRTKNKKNANS